MLFFYFELLKQKFDESISFSFENQLYIAYPVEYLYYCLHHSS